MTRINKETFMYNLKTYGTDFARWPDADKLKDIDIDDYLSDQKIKGIYETERQTEEALDLLKTEETPDLIGSEDLINRANKHEATTWLPNTRKLAIVSLFAVLVILPLFFTQDSPRHPSISVDQFLNEMATLTDPEKIDPNVFFEEMAKAPRNQDIEKFLNDLFETPSDPIKDKDIWEIFTNGTNARG